MVRDAEDLVHPWVNYTSREVMDSYVFNYTFAAGEIIEITGQTTFRTYKIVEEAYYVRFLGTVKWGLSFTLGCINMDSKLAKCPGRSKKLYV